MEKKEIELWYTEEEKLYAYIYEYSDYKILEFKFINSNFSGKGTIYLDEYYKKYYFEKIDEMILLGKGELVINDSESQYYIKLYYKNDNLCVNGYIGDYSDYSLEFDFKSDQTILGLIKKVLNLAY